MERRARVAIGLAALAAGAAAVGAVPAVGASGGACPTTQATRTARPDANAGPAGFNHGAGRLRAHLTWRNGTLAAGLRPDGGSIATVEEDGSIHTKLGWWRGVSGRLTISGRRLDARAPALVAHVPSGYGRLGFQPTGLVFPTDGCWRVVGRVGGVELTFVVKVTKLPWH